MANTSLIDKLIDLKSDLYDEESAILQTYGLANGDLFGNETRRLARLRNHQATISEAIHELETKKNEVSILY